MPETLIHARSERETVDAGRAFGETLQPGDIVCLHGDLGAGKTAFARGIAASLGIEEPVTSPSFTLVNSYEGRCTLHHFDAWRVADEDELLAIGFEEYADGRAIVLIEWAERITGLLPDDAIHVHIDRMDDEQPHAGTQRRIRIRRKGE